MRLSHNVNSIHVHQYSTLVSRNCQCRHIPGGPTNGMFFWYALTSSNIHRFSKLFQCQNREKICNNTITKDPTTPQVYCTPHVLAMHNLRHTLDFQHYFVLEKKMNPRWHIQTDSNMLTL